MHVPRAAALRGGRRQGQHRARRHHRSRRSRRSSRSSTASTAPSPPATPRRSPTAPRALLLMSEEKAKALGLRAARASCARYAFAATDPADQLLQGPAYAAPLALDRAGLKLDGHRPRRDARGLRRAGRVEPPGVRLASSSPRSSAARAPLGEVDRTRLNVNGGSIALGHPFAATGARIVHSGARRAEAAEQEHRARAPSAPPAASAPPSSWSVRDGHRPTPSTSRYAVEDGVAVITFDMRGRAGQHPLARDLAPSSRQLMTRAASRTPSVKAVVFISGKKDSFIAGAKIDFLADAQDARPRPPRSPARPRSASTGSTPSRSRWSRRSTAPASAAGWSGRWPATTASSPTAPRPSLGLPEVQLGLMPGARRHAAAAAADRRAGGARPDPHRQEPEGQEGAEAGRGRRGGARADPPRGRARSARCELADGSAEARPRRAAWPLKSAAQGKGLADDPPGPRQQGGLGRARAGGQPARPQGALRPGEEAAAEEDPRQVPRAREGARGGARRPGERA